MTNPRAFSPLASRPEDSRGRRFIEPGSVDRTVFQRDRDRIIHSSAFRRLMHKTQVFVHHVGDHFRTRLTHSLEVAQIARSASRTLGFEEDLAEALALAHDLGHTPFGHAGEEALDRAMAEFGGFDHNAQTLRILTKLEARYAEFDGLNPTWETLEGVVKHNGPLVGPGIDTPLPAAIVEYMDYQDLELHTWPGPEAQVAALADDIAYNNHDIDDGLRAGLFVIDDLLDVPLVGPVFREVMDLYPGLEPRRVRHETVRRLIDRMVRDLIGETRRRIDEFGPDSTEAVRLLGRPLVAFSEEMAANDRALKDFLYKNMYRHYKVTRTTDHARRVVSRLFSVYLDRPELMPAEWIARWQAGDRGRQRTARVVADYIAGMTDRFALAEYERLIEVD